jgi:hypothetical protein
MKIIEKIIGYLVIAIILFAIGGAIVLFNTYQQNTCIKKGGMVIDSSFGFFEKCIYGG